MLDLLSFIAKILKLLWGKMYCRKMSSTNSLFPNCFIPLEKKVKWQF